MNRTLESKPQVLPPVCCDVGYVITNAILRWVDGLIWCSDVTAPNQTAIGLACDWWSPCGLAPSVGLLLKCDGIIYSPAWNLKVRLAGHHTHTGELQVRICPKVCVIPRNVLRHDQKCGRDVSYFNMKHLSSRSKPLKNFAPSPFHVEYDLVCLGSVTSDARAEQWTTPRPLRITQTSASGAKPVSKAAKKGCSACKPFRGER